jgi:hypothetical protein
MDGEDQLNRSCERRSITKGQEGKEHKIKQRKANWIGYIFRMNCVVKHVIKGKTEKRIEVTER